MRRKHYYVIFCDGEAVSIKEGREAANAAIRAITAIGSVASYINCVSEHAAEEFYMHWNYRDAKRA